MSDIPEVDLSKIDDMPTPNTSDLVYGKTNSHEMVEFLQKQKANTINYVVDSRSLEYTDEGLLFQGKEGYTIAAKPNSWALGQLIDKTMADRSYYKKCEEKGPSGLGKQNINAWLKHNRQLQLLRVTGNTVRAFLSNGYLVLDNYDIVKEIAISCNSINMMRKLNGQALVTIDKGYLTEGNMYIELLDPSKPYDIGRDQTFFGMVVISNSDVGGGALHFDAGFYQWACANLHIKNVVGKKIHRGEKMPEQIFGAEIVQKQARLWIDAIGKGITNILSNDDLFTKWASEMRELREINVPEPTKVIQEMNVFTENEVEDIANMLAGDKTIAAEDRGTGFALVSAMTNAAKGWGGDRRHEVGKIAGEAIKVLA